MKEIPRVSLTIHIEPEKNSGVKECIEAANINWRNEKALKEKIRRSMETEDTIIECTKCGIIMLNGFLVELFLHVNRNKDLQCLILLQ